MQNIGVKGGRLHRREQEMGNRKQGLRWEEMKGFQDCGTA